MKKYEEETVAKLVRDIVDAMEQVDVSVSICPVEGFELS